jgi:CCR4-NOT transcription complex subunit 4
MLSDNESDDSDAECPLCVEPFDVSDRNFLPCPCGYHVCMWCWHNIRENLNGLCPACRSPYNADPHAFMYSAADRDDVLRKQKERRIKERQEKKTGSAGVNVAEQRGSLVRLALQQTDRRHLHNYRVIQRNLVYVIGVPVAATTEEILRRPEYFGQYGKIGKIVVHGNRSITHATVSVYITFSYKEDAKASIQVLDGHWLDGHHLRASFGTTKYCNNFIRGVPCNNPECVYLHDIGEDEDRFTKEEIQAGHSKLVPIPEANQTLVTGCGGPSGTGKRPVGETVLPPPIFLQDIGPSAKPLSKPVNWQSVNADIETTETTTYIITSAPPTPEQLALMGVQDVLPPLSMPAPVIDDVSSFPALRRESALEVARSDAKIEDLKVPQYQPAAASPHALDVPESELLLSLRHQYTEGRSEALRRRSLAAAYNGLGNCAVFPVPVSSLAVSVWNDILNASSTDLCVNPYGELPFSELLELTLPPVDAASAQTHWPRPLDHYSRGVEGTMHAALKQHNPRLISSPTPRLGSAGTSILGLQQVFPSVKVHRTVGPGITS